MKNVCRVLRGTTRFKRIKNYTFRSGSNPVRSGLGPVLVRSGFREAKTRTGPDPAQLYSWLPLIAHIKSKFCTQMFAFTRLTFST